MKSSSNLIVLAIFAISIATRLALSFFMSINYDETAVAHSSFTLATHWNTIDFIDSSDTFLFPPLFASLTAFLIKAGIADSLWAARTVAIAIASGIAPMIYLLAKNSGYSEKISVTSAIIWLITPAACYYSVAAQGDMPMLFFVLLALYLIQKADTTDSVPLAILSGIVFAVAIWMKESAIGFIPVFIYLIYHRKETLILWLVSAIVFVLPLGYILAVNDNLNYFGEISKLRFDSSSINPDAVIGNIGMLLGLVPRKPEGFYYTITAFLFITVILSFMKLEKNSLQERFVLRAGLVTLAILVPFFIVFPKKFAYYLLPSYLFLIFFIAPFVIKRKAYGVLYFAVLLALSVAGLFNMGDKRGENNMHAAVEHIRTVKPDSRIAMTQPRMAEYFVKKAGIWLNIINIEEPLKKRTSIYYKNPTRVLIDNNYFLGTDFQIFSLFCETWPPSAQSCDMQGHASAMQKLKLVKNWDDLKLYEIGK